MLGATQSVRSAGKTLNSRCVLVAGSSATQATPMVTYADHFSRTDIGVHSVRIKTHMATDLDGMRGAVLVKLAHCKEAELGEQMSTRM